MSISSLPTELLVKIFNYLSIETLNVIESTCLRWSLIIVDNFYKSFLLQQDYSIRKKYKLLPWSAGTSSPALTRSLFQQVYKDLPSNWREGRFIRSPGIQVGEYNAGSEGQVSSLAIYKDKIYLGKCGSSVEVRSTLDLSLIRVINQGFYTGPLEQRRPCKLCLHGRTLAVLGPDRTRVSVFNTDTDHKVGEIETALGAVYNIAIADKVLVLLSGWTIFHWKIDSGLPEYVRGQFLGSIPDFQNDQHFQNWLDAHEVAVNSAWLVTRATRMRAQGEEGMRMTHFLHVRRVHPSGIIGPIVRPESSRLPDTVYETTCMALSAGDLLAVGWRVMDEGVMTIMDLNSGDRIHNIQSPHFLASIQIPLKWEGSKLFLKIIPVYRPTTSDDTDEFGVSLGYLDLQQKDLTVVPGLLFESSEDLLALDRTKVYRVSTKLERLESNSEENHIDLNMDLEAYALLESEEADYNPVYSVNITIYDFWNQKLS